MALTVEIKLTNNIWSRVSVFWMFQQKMECRRIHVIWYILWCMVGEVRELEWVRIPDVSSLLVFRLHTDCCSCHSFILAFIFLIFLSYCASGVICNLPLDFSIVFLHYICYCLCYFSSTYLFGLHSQLHLVKTGSHSRIYKLLEKLRAAHTFKIITIIPVVLVPFGVCPHGNGETQHTNGFYSHTLFPLSCARGQFCTADTVLAHRKYVLCTHKKI